MSQSLETLVNLILPEGLLDYFTVTQVHQELNEIWIHIEEQNIIPKEHESSTLTSKGFLPESKIQDFPIRGKAVVLYVKRRRWLNTDTGEIVTRNWDLISEGTRMTKEFASFLKELSGYRSSKL